jgi:diacylglycerol O-acyltransferase / wax synthase
MTYTHHERLSGVDAAFLAVEDDCAHMHIGSVGLFEIGPLRVGENGIDVDRVRELIEVQLHKIPRFRQRLAHVPISGSPVWIDDPSFHLDYHVRHTALPHPGDEHQLARLTSRVMSQHLDRRRPLWELWLVEGLEGGQRFALISKIHHAMADGISGVDLMSALIGSDPDFRPGRAPAWVPRPAPGALDLLSGELWHRVGTAASLVRSGVRSAGKAAGAADSPGDLVSRVRHTVSALAAGLGTPAPTPLNLEIGPNRRFAWLRVDLDVLREIRKGAGGTLNDVVLAVVTGAVRGFLERRGSATRDLEFRVMVPVSVRSDDERGRLGNRVTQLLVPLPLDAPSPLERLRVVSERTQALKRSGQAEGGQVLTGLTDLLPPQVATAIERAAVRRSFGNMVVTNVPGPRGPSYLLGARLLECYPLVPLASHQGLNVAVLSYDGHLHWGVNADYDAIPDVEDFVVLLREEVDALRTAATGTARATEVA